MGTIHSIAGRRASSPPASPPPPSPLPARYKIRTARELAEERRRAPAESRFATATPALDRLLAGGLERSAMTELVGHRSSGRFALVTSVLAAVTSAGETAALIDLGDGFDPRSAAAAGVDLERLLWVRPRRVKEVLASAEVILGTGMPLVVIELGFPPLPGGRGAEAAWLRLARAARAHRAALLVASPYRASGTAAQVVLETPAARARWGGRGAGPRILRGLHAEVEVVKSRRGDARHSAAGSHREAVAWSAVGGPLGAPLGEELRSAPRAPRVVARERAIA